MGSYTQQICSSYDKNDKESYLSILSRITNEETHGDLYLVYNPFLYKIRNFSGKEKFEKDKKVVDMNLTLDSFKDALISIEFKENSSMWERNFSLKSNGFFDENYNLQEAKDFGYYQRASAEEVKVKMLKRIHDLFLKELNEIIKYHYFKHDPYFKFRPSNLKYFKEVYMMFKNNILNDLIDQKKFIEEISPIFDRKIEKAFDLKFPKSHFESSPYVYLLREDIDFEHIMKNGLPHPCTFQLMHVQAEENEYSRSNNKICYYFSKNLYQDTEYGFNDVKSELLKIEQSIHGFHAQYSRGSYLLFFTLEEAKEYHKKKLRAVKSQIEQILKEDKVAKF